MKSRQKIPASNHNMFFFEEIVKYPRLVTKYSIISHLIYVSLPLTIDKRSLTWPQLSLLSGIFGYAQEPTEYPVECPDSTRC